MTIITIITIITKIIICTCTNIQSSMRCAAYAWRVVEFAAGALGALDARLSARICSARLPNTVDVLWYAPAVVFSAPQRAVPVALAAVALASGGDVVACGAALAGVAVTGAAVHALKAALARERPRPPSSGESVLGARARAAIVGRYAMPSGDAACMACVAAHLEGLGFGGTGALAAAVVALGRVRFGCHYAGDTLVGALVGALVGRATVITLQS
jgi:membrane-associated phospholipid phosphatase